MRCAPPARKLRAYGYCRVSTGEQCHSLEVQADLLRERANSIPGVTWAGAFREQTSAKEVRYHQRETFPALMKLLRPGDYLLVWRLDRLERDWFGMAEALGWCAEQKIHVIVLQHAGVELDLTSAQGRMLAWVFSGMAEFENEQKSQTSKDSFHWRKERGFFAGGRIPLGKRPRPVKGTGKQDKPLKILVPDEHEMALIREMIGRVDAGESMLSVAEDFYRRRCRRSTGTRSLICSKQPNGEICRWALQNAYKRYKQPGVPGGVREEEIIAATAVSSAAREIASCASSDGAT